MSFWACTVSLCTPVVQAADKVESIEVAKGVSHYESSKYYSNEIPVHFEGTNLELDVDEILETQSFKLRTSARPRKDKDDSALERKLKIRGVCNYVFSSVIAKMQAHAAKTGANAVINIRSDYGGKAAEESGSYDCIRGS
ncbi:MAG: YbjQ family protein, partial [Acidiferrobacterales bacterium]|nr:YbjQ family protein [Acidiferrobacterales bacterium]